MSSVEFQSFEIKTEVDSNDGTECTDDDRLTTAGMFFAVVPVAASTLLLLLLFLVKFFCVLLRYTECKSPTLTVYILL